MPVAFKEKYSSTRVVIDCTEFKIEKPANPDVQAETWSSYKNGNTFKLLVGVTPGAVISFLSPLWGGRISNKEITKRSSLLDTSPAMRVISLGIRTVPVLSVAKKLAAPRPTPTAPAVKYGLNRQDGAD